MQYYDLSFLRHRQNRLSYKKELGTKVPSQPYLVNVFLISCSPAELISASVDKDKCKTILGLKFKCKFAPGLSINLSKNCKLFSGRVTFCVYKDMTSLRSAKTRPFTLYKDTTSLRSAGTQPCLVLE